MFSQLDALQDYDYLFNITMNPYGRDIEKNVPRIQERVEVYKRLSAMVGRSG